MNADRRLAAAIAGAALIGIALLILVSSPRIGPAPVAPRGKPPVTSPEAGVGLPIDSVLHDTSASVEPADAESATQPHASPAPPVTPMEAQAALPPAAVTPPRPDLEARDWIDIRVVDPESVPVSEAQLTIRGLRPEGDRGSYFGFRGEPSIATTDLDGRARLSYWTWVHERGRTLDVDLYVSHPDFVPYRDSSLAIGPGEHLVVLQRGATVVVSGWIGSRDSFISDVRVQCDSDAKLRPESWTPERSGRLATSRLAPGPHLILLQHESEAHGLCFSDVTRFMLDEGELEELHLELFPAERFEGVLDSNVPRPIVDGRARIGMTQGGRSGEEPWLHREFDADVRADGTFVIEKLPRSRGQIFVLCRGWVSKRTLADSALDAGIHFGGPEPPTPEHEALALENMGDRAFQWQRVRSPQPDRPFVVLMEPTGTIVVRVERPDGSPIAGAEAGASPNVCFIGAGCSIAPWRRWSGTADGDGRVWVDDVPPQVDLRVVGRHEDYEPPWEFRWGVRTTVKSGETTRVSVKLEPKRD